MAVGGDRPQGERPPTDRHGGEVVLGDPATRRGVPAGQWASTGYRFLPPPPVTTQATPPAETNRW